jgi:glutaredoxin
MGRAVDRGGASRATIVGVVLLAVGVSLALGWWQRRHQTTLGDAVAALTRPGDIHMISSDTCGFCIRARRWFEQHDVAFTECSIEREPACRQAFDALGAPGTPVIVVRGQPTLGFDAERLRRRLAGEAGG